MTSTNRQEHWCGWDANDSRWDDERATIDYGVAPRPGTSLTPPPPPGGRARRALRPILVSAGALLLFIGLMAWQDRGASSPDSSDAQMPSPPAVGCSVTSTSQTTPTPADHRPPDVLTYEIDLEGCARAISYDRGAGLLTVPDVGTYAVGAPGDWLGVGDWNCDGIPTPALYRPPSGELFVFDGWAGDEALRSEPPTIEVLHGNPEIIDDAGCDRLVVHPPG